VKQARGISQIYKKKGQTSRAENRSEEKSRVTGERDPAKEQGRSTRQSKERKTGARNRAENLGKI